jgi:hypothetical protein
MSGTHLESKRRGSSRAIVFADRFSAYYVPIVSPRAAAARSIAACCRPSSCERELTRTLAEDVPVEPWLVFMETHGDT